VRLAQQLTAGRAKESLVFGAAARFLLKTKEQKIWPLRRDSHRKRS
jgi:hypothetical protein